MADKSHEILEVACGYGRVCIPLAKAGYRVTGLDLMPPYIRRARSDARKLRLRIQFDIGSMMALPYESAQFDRIFCVWSSFNHLLTRRDQRRALNEMHRVLAPGGMAFIDTANGESKSLHQRVEAEGTGPDGRLWGAVFNGVKNLSYVHTRKTLARICDSSRFRKVRVGFKNIFHRRRLVAYLYR